RRLSHPDRNDRTPPRQTRPRRAPLEFTGRAYARMRPRHRLLLRPRRERPPRRRTAEQRDELAAFHSITSSASARSLSGTWRPSAFAVLRLITSSNLVGCMTGKVAGLAPLRIFPAYTPIWLNASERCVP